MTNQPETDDRRERYATAIHDAMEPDLSLVDQEPAYQALIARAAEAAEALADAEQNRQVLTTLANLGIATHRLDRIRDAARLHRQQLLGTSELYAVIEADDAPAPAVVSAAVAPPTDHTTPSQRAALRDEIVKALGRITTVPPVAHRQEQADHVLAVLYREWPWLRAEAEDAEPADQTALRDRIAAIVAPFFANFCNEEAAMVNAQEVAAAVLPATTDQTADLETARATNQRLNREKQQLESELAAYRRAVGQWEVSERGTYIPHSSLRAIGLASGKDILGSVRHLKHFERVEQAEAEVERLRADRAAIRAEILNEQGPEDQETLAEAAAAYRWLRPVIEATMTDSARWDGDESEEVHLGRYVQWLAAQAQAPMTEAQAERLATLTDCHGDTLHCEHYQEGDGDCCRCGRANWCPDDDEPAAGARQDGAAS